MRAPRFDDCVCFIASAYPEHIAQDSSSLFLHFPSPSELFQHFGSSNWPKQITVVSNSWAELLEISSRLESGESFQLEVQRYDKSFVVIGVRSPQITADKRYFGPRFSELDLETESRDPSKVDLVPVGTHHVDGKAQEISALKVRLAQVESRLAIHEARIRKIKSIPGAKFAYLQLRKARKWWPLTKLSFQ